MSQKFSNKLIFKSGLVGLLSGLIGAVFHTILNAINNLRKSFIGNIDGSMGLLLLFLVLICAAVTLSLFLVRKFAPETAGSGVPQVETTLRENKKIHWQRVIPVKFIGGILAMGSGLVLGREGPTIHMGSAFGDMFGTPEDKFHHHVLVAAGAAAGLAAAFNAPLAGLIFVTEEMRDHFKYNFQSLMAVIFASCVSVIVVQILNGQQPDILNASFHAPKLTILPLFVVLGVFFGLLGTLFNRLMLKGVSFSTKLKGIKPYLLAVIIALMIGIVAYFLPDATGGGHDSLELALSNRFSTGVLLSIFLLRFMFTIFSYAIGTPGGIFAPMLALGTFIGLWFGQIAVGFFPELIKQPGIFAIGGMGALFAATVQAPITGIVLIVEMTRSYELILPLMVTCLSASLVANRLGGKPIYSQLAKLS
ncbi:MAG: H(+)/Cl(-) exchange transporter ClcA [Desulfobacteraceae bacterium]|nr:H(+)/Cl(-) exchange transporter ClcA [Desulfobacteraceae bacterium]